MREVIFDLGSIIKVKCYEHGMFTISKKDHEKSGQSMRDLGCPECSDNPQQPAALRKKATN